jgi:hypothetical protein
MTRRKNLVPKKVPKAPRAPKGKLPQKEKRRAQVLSIFNATKGRAINAKTILALKNKMPKNLASIKTAPVAKRHILYRYCRDIEVAFGQVKGSVSLGVGFLLITALAKISKLKAIQAAGTFKIKSVNQKGEITYQYLNNKNQQVTKVHKLTSNVNSLSALPKLSKKALTKFMKRHETTAQRRTVSMNEINTKCLKITGKSLFDYCNADGSLNGVFRNKAEFMSKMKKYVSEFKIGNYGKSFALFSAFAEEANFKKNSDGSLVIKEFAGMNVPHTVVLKMFNELFKGVTIDSKGVPHGTGTLKIDVGTGAKMKVRIDFDKKTITPLLRSQGRLSTGELDPSNVVKFNDLMDFLNVYLKKNKSGEALLIRQGGTFKINSKRGIPNGMNIFQASFNPKLARHELMHALYDADPKYKRKIQNKVRRSSREQRECAVLYTSCGYDVFDPDTPNISKDIVIDEAYNAHAQQGSYNVQSGVASKTSAGNFCDQYNISLNLNIYSKIDELPINASYKAGLKQRKASKFSNLTEKQFINKNKRELLSSITDMKVLRKLLIKQQPATYNKVVKARRNLVDWVDRRR